MKPGGEYSSERQLTDRGADQEVSGAQIHYQIRDAIQYQHEEMELDSRASREQLVVINQQGYAVGGFIKTNKDVEDLATEFWTDKKGKAIKTVKASVGGVAQLEGGLPSTRETLDSSPSSGSNSLGWSSRSFSATE